MKIVANDPMPLGAFWDLIASHSPLATGSPDSLVARLLAGGLPMLKAFHARLADLAYALDTRVHAGPKSGEYFSPDDFLDRRMYVIALGREAYEGYLQQPRRIPDEICTSLEGAAEEALNELPGHEDSWLATELSVFTGSNTAGWASRDR